MIKPESIQIVGDELAIRWADGGESFLKHELLRVNSPSAENIGEPDILGRRQGGNKIDSAAGVRVLSYEVVGNYALRLDFSDGHRTGIYRWDYLRALDSDQSSQTRA